MRVTDDEPGRRSGLLPLRSPAATGSLQDAASTSSSSVRVGDPFESVDGTRRLRYGVGLRVLFDRPLLRQIREELLRLTMRPEQIAALENVGIEELVLLIDTRLGGAGSGAQLRRFADANAGYSVIAWRTSRSHPSKLHLLSPEGMVVCGTPPGGEQIIVHSGPCRTCGALVGLDPYGRVVSAAAAAASGV